MRNNCAVKLGKLVITWVDMRLESLKLNEYPDYFFSEHSSSKPLPTCVLASEKDELDDLELAGRAEVWMKLIRLSLPSEEG